MEEQCLCKNIPQETIDAITASLPQQEETERMAEFFKIFGDPTRLRMVHTLMHQELCVADLAALMQMQQPAVSHQLKILRMARLVKHRKAGQTIYYSLDDGHIAQVFSIALQHIKEN